MNKIIFANNPLDRKSGFRSDKDWQKANLLDNETRFVVFHSGKPLTVSYTHLRAHET